MTDWTWRWINEAKLQSTYSKDPSSKIGAVAVGKHNQIIATAYNGFPRGFPDTEEMWNDREQKYKFVIHAEQNLIYNSSLTGVSLDGATVYVFGLPVCNTCACALYQAGVRVVFSAGDVKDNWYDSNILAVRIFKQLGVKYRHFHAQDVTEYLENPYRKATTELRTSTCNLPLFKK